jgi:hypothetical protein
LHPSTHWHLLAAHRTLKFIENGPWLKKSGHPWSMDWVLHQKTSQDFPKFFSSFLFKCSQLHFYGLSTLVAMEE